MSDEPATAGNGVSGQLSLQAIYLKDCSFEAPLGPRSTGDWSPQVGMDINTAINTLEGNLREVVLTITVSAKQGERTAFLIEVKQAGAFIMQNLSEDEFRRAAGVVCPSVLFPYARAAVSQLVSQGGFPQLLLPPVNFESLFANQSSPPDVTRN